MISTFLMTCRSMTGFFSLDETHLFSSAVVNDFRFGFVRINNSLINVPPRNG